MPRMTKKQKNELHWQRVNHVRCNPNDITDDEIRNYTFLCGLVNIPMYGKEPEIVWKLNKINGRYTVQHHMHHKGQSRSGKSHYWYNWFDVLDHEQNVTFQVSHYLNEDGTFILKGYERNIFSVLD